MPGPLILILHSRVKPGKAEQYRAHVRDATELVESEEPQMIAFHCYRSDDGTEVSTVQVHPDAESMDTHVKLYRERLSDRALDALDSYEVTVYGTPSQASRDFLEQLATQDPGVRLRVLPLHEAGFLRPQPL